MLFHLTYRFETCNFTKHFDSFKKTELVTLELYISDMLKQVPEKTGQAMTFCAWSNTLTDAEEKDLKEKFKLEPKELMYFDTGTTLAIGNMNFWDHISVNSEWSCMSYIWLFNFKS